MLCRVHAGFGGGTLVCEENTCENTCEENTCENTCVGTFVRAHFCAENTLESRVWGREHLSEHSLGLGTLIRAHFWAGNTYHPFGLRTLFVVKAHL